MTYSVSTKVTNNIYNGQIFLLYKEVKETLKTLSEEEAKNLESILNEYPKVFSETRIVPKEDEEIKFLDISKVNNEPPLDFDFENVSEDCDGLLEKLEDNFSTRICGIDRDETVRQIFENK